MLNGIRIQYPDPMNSVDGHLTFLFSIRFSLYWCTLPIYMSFGQPTFALLPMHTFSFRRMAFRALRFCMRFYSISAERSQHAFRFGRVEFSFRRHFIHFQLLVLLLLLLLLLMRWRLESGFISSFCSCSLASHRDQMYRIKLQTAHILI